MARDRVREADIRLRVKFWEISMGLDSLQSSGGSGGMNQIWMPETPKVFRNFSSCAPPYDGNPSKVFDWCNELEKHLSRYEIMEGNVLRKL